MTWIKVDDLYPEHPDTLAAGEDAAWLNLCGIAYCSRNLTDGWIPKVAVPRLTSKRKPMELAEKLVKVGYWRDEGEHFVVVEYLQEQRSKEDIESLRKTRQEAGKQGGKAKASGKQTATKTLPDTETEAVTDVSTPLTPASGGGLKLNPRATGTNPRAVAAREREASTTARLAEIEACPDCDDNGIAYDESSDTALKCDHGKVAS